MSLLDDGPHTLLLYPAVRRETGRGNIELVPAQDPVRVEGVWVFPTSAAQTGSQTQVATHEVRCARFPAGAWSKVTWEGRGVDFDVVAVDPMPGSERARHDVVRLRARKPPGVPGG